MARGKSRQNASSRVDFKFVSTLEVLADNVVVNRPVVEARFAVLNVGGDFADDATAYGSSLGSDVFVYYQRKLLWQDSMPTQGSDLLLL
jgi:hypothetical protein